MKATFKLFIILFISTFFQNHLFAQITDELKNQIKFSPARTIDPVNPGLELSYERLFARSFSGQLSAAYMTDLFKGTNYASYQGYRLGIEGKYFITKKKVARPYLAGELIYYNADIEIEDSVLTSNTTSNYFEYETYNLTKRMTILNAKFGFEFIIKHFVIDVCAGLGVKHKNIVYHGDSRPEHGNFFPTKYQIYFSEGVTDTFTVPINIKLGVVF